MVRSDSCSEQAAAVIDRKPLLKGIRLFNQARRLTSRRITVGRPSIRLPRPTISPAMKRSIIALIVLGVILFLIFGTARFWVNLWWFDSMGYRSILVRRYLAESLTFLG